MGWNFKYSDRPLYTQIIEQIQMKILSGEYSAGSKLPSVRDMACDASVNPNTMQKALSELERIGIVYSQRTSGRFITEDYKMINNIKKSIAKEQINEFLENMLKLGYNKKEILSLIETSIKEMN
jgi:DNA-binding transcriptional regulator YhcF (GntR family)